MGSGILSTDDFEKINFSLKLILYNWNFSRVCK